MFEKFTDRSRRVMALANQEGTSLNHEYLNPAHILLGLMKEGNGVASKVLENLGINLDIMRKEVAKCLKPGTDLVLGKLPQDVMSRKIIDEAIKSSMEFKDNHVGTEHILMGILTTENNIALKILENLGLSKEKIKEEIFHLISHPVNVKKIHTVEKINLVYDLAKSGHAGQKRSNGQDYINHPYSVMQRLINCGINNEDVLCVALCHDLLEDTSVTEEEIRNIAGETVLEAVKQLTNKDPVGEKRDFATKTKDMLEHAKHYSDIAKMVKLADRYDNLADAIWEWKPERVKKYANAGLSLITIMEPLPVEILDFAKESKRFFQCLA